MPLDLEVFKPVPDTDGDATQVAGGFTTIEEYVNGNIEPTALAQAGAAPGQVMTWNGLQWIPLAVPQPTKALGFVNRTTDISVNVTTEATAVAILTLPAVTTDGVTPVMLTLSVPALDNQNVTKLATIVWADGATVLGQSKHNSPAASGATTGFERRHRYVPAAGSHTWAAKVYVSTGTCIVKAGAGAAGVLVPAFLEARYAG